MRLKIIAVVAPLMICVAYLTLWERKAIGWSQIRPGPNRVGPFGLLTPIADAVKLIFKEIILPTAANRPLFLLGPVMTIMPALAAWAVVPFGPDAALSNINVVCARRGVRWSLLAGAHVRRLLKICDPMRELPVAAPSAKYSRARPSDRNLLIGGYN